MPDNVNSYSDYINYIATTLSIIGGIIAIWQAAKARSDATKVEEYRNEIITVRKAADFSEIETVLNRTINFISKYGPSASSASLFGVDPQKDADEVQYFITILRKNKILFPDDYREVDKFCNELSACLENLVLCSATDTTSMKRYGTKIYHRLTDFSAILKGNLDILKEARK
ncbi:TPA: hypothetical protein ACGTRV_004425, partial [Vibrio parahaemolyticus]|nr:hypothetical protein [Vibrio parahaemolyticus]